MEKIEKIFAKIMRIVNEILLKILDKLKKNKFFKKDFESLKKLVENQRQIMYIIENMRLINDNIRNFKT